MTGALYKTYRYKKLFVYQCQVLGFKPGKVKIRYIVHPAMFKTAIVKWVPVDYIQVYTY